MFRFSHFAAPAVLGAALLVGVQGCANDRKDMPGNAQLISEGRETVSATAPHDGTVYIYDDNSNKNVYSGRVNKGDNIKVDARENRVMFNDRVALDHDLTNDHRYQIYFDRDESRDALNAARPANTIVQPGSSGTTIVQPNGNSTTVVPPAPQSNTTIVQPPPSNTTTVIPPAPSNTGTTVQPNPDGSTTVTTPAR